MPPKGWKRGDPPSVASTQRSAKKPKPELPSRPTLIPVEAPSMPFTKNNGELGVDGLRVRPSLWSNCTDEECGRPIYFIRIGERCTRHKLKLETKATNV